MELFNCSEHKAIKVKAELTSTGLLFQKQLGFNPKTTLIKMQKGQIIGR